MAWLRRHVPRSASPPVRRHHPVRRRGWARRLALGTAGAFLLGVALLGHVSPGQATGIGIRLWDLVSRGEVSIWDMGIVDLSNLDAHQTYEVVVTTSNSRIVGIGDCLGASEWSTITGSTSRSLAFVIRGCTPGHATVTIEVFAGGATSAAARVIQHVTIVPIPQVVPHQRAAAERAKKEVRDLLAGGVLLQRPVQRPFPPRLFGYVSRATTSTTTVSWATWWPSAPTGDVETIGFQIRYRPYYEPSNITSAEIFDANAWQHRLTGLAPDTWYAINMRACTNQGGCTSAPWSHDYQFKTLPG